MKSEARMSLCVELCGGRFRHLDLVIPSDFVIRHSCLRITVHGLVPACGAKPLGTPEAFTAVQAFVAGTIADGDVAAVRTGRRVLLKVSYGLAQVCNFTLRSEER